MKNILDENDVWDTVEKPLEEGRKESRRKADLKAKNLIMTSVSDAQLEYILEEETAHGMWERLKRLHTQSTIAQLWKALGNIMDIADRKNAAVDEKAQRLKNWNAEIKSVKESASLDDTVLLAFLFNSMSEDYETTVEVLKSQADLKWEDAVARLKSREIELQGRELKEAALAAGKGTQQGKCYHCGRIGHHRYECKRWLRTDEGKRYAKGQEEEPARDSDESVKSKRRATAKGRKPGKNSNKRGRGHARAAYATDTSDEESERSSAAGSKHGTMLAREQGLTAGSTPNAARTRPWIVDSGATSHISSERELFTQMREISDHITIADGRRLTIKGIGTVKLPMGAQRKRYRCVTIKRVLYVPECDCNLLSLSRLLDTGKKLDVRRTSLTIRNERNEIVATASRRGGLFCLDRAEYEAEMLLLAARATQAQDQRNNGELWHKRLGHLGATLTAKLESTVNGIGNAHLQGRICESCVQAKATRKVFATSETRARRRLERVHTDIWGPAPTPAIDGSRYMLTLTDDKTRRVWVYLLKHRSEFVETFYAWKKRVEKQSGELVKNLRCDNAKEYVGKHIRQRIEDEGIEFEPTVEYTPEENGVSERMNRTLVEKANALRADYELPGKYWGLAAEAAAYLYNRTPNRKLKRTPEEIWSEVKPDQSHLRVFGCTAYVTVPKEKRDKIAAKTWRGIFVGYTKSSKIYRVFDPVKEKVVRASSVIFDETPIQSHRPAMTPRPEGSMQVEVEATPLRTQGEPTATQEEPRSQEKPQAQAQEELQAQEEQAPEASTQASEGTVLQEETEDETGADNDQPMEDTIVVDTSAASTTPAPRRRPGRPRGAKAKKPQTDELTRKSGRPTQGKLPSRFMALAQSYVYEPATYEEAMADRQYSAQWAQAISEEIKALEKNNTWELVDLPSGRKPVGSKWVFKVKRRQDGSIEKFKARAVARGFSQRYGIDYEETYAPTVHYDTFRMLLAHAAIEDLEIHQMDVNNAYLATEAEEEIYMCPPPGYEANGKYCRLRKCIYGLKQAARAWHKLFSGHLESIGFEKIPDDPCIMINDKATILIYVDDLLIFGKQLKDVESAKQAISQRFNVKDKGEVKDCLGLSITRDRSRRSIRIDQSAYALEIVKRFGLENTAPVSTPMRTDALKALAERSKPANKTLYQRAVGSLGHLLQTRPDIANAVNRVSQFSADPETHHWKAVLHAIRYIYGTLDYGIVYSGEHADREVTAYADSDFAGDATDRKSTMGYVFLLAGGPIAWSCQKQRSVARSSTEAEYMALGHATAHALWSRRMYAALTRRSAAAITVHGDNLSSLEMVSDEGRRSKAKHIDVQHHFVRNEQAKGNIRYSYCPTQRMLADGLTKPLPRGPFEEKRTGLGLQPPGQQP